MAEQMNQVIDKLCEKLGIAAEHLYPLMVRQAYVDGVKSIIGCIISILIIVTYLKFLHYFYLYQIDGNNRYSEAYKNDTEFAIQAITVILGIIAAVFILVFVIDTNSAINAFSNPEWYAIRSLLNQVK